MGLGFPADYPGGCPLEGSAPASGDHFRCTRNNPPTPADFLSMHELNRPIRGNKPADVCKSRGLSVFRLIEHARHQLELLPVLGPYIACRTLGEYHGLTKPTPAKDRPSHTTWWPYDGVERHDGFVVVEQT